MKQLDPNFIDGDVTICEFDAIIRETEKSVLVDFGDCEHWIPRSACEYGRDKDSGIPIIAIDNWKYRQLGL